MYIREKKAEPFKLWLAEVAKETRLKLEAETGKKVVSPLNAKNILYIDDNKEVEDKAETE